MNIEPDESARGNCYAAALSMMVDGRSGPGRVLLCHGIPTCAQPPHLRMGHAWLELNIVGVWFVRDGLYPSALVERRRYYEIGGIDPDEVVRYTPAQAAALALSTGRPGPWCPRVAAAAHAGDRE